jgi:hypothetical protein
MDKVQKNHLLSEPFRLHEGSMFLQNVGSHLQVGAGVVQPV